MELKCLQCGATIPEGLGKHGLHSKCFSEVFDVEDGLDFSNLTQRSTASKPEEAKFSSFFHGKFKKYSGNLGKKNYILKVQQKDFPELPGVEYVCNRIAQTLSLQVPDFYYVLFNNTAPTFISRNIMDKAGVATLDHIYKFLPEGQEFNCQNLIASIEKETGRLSETERFVELCLFDALTGNSDRHGRNIAFITKAGGVRMLSPFYDNPSYIGIEEEYMLESDLQPKGQIFTSKDKEPSISDYVEEFQRLGFESTVEAFIERTLQSSTAVFSNVSNSKYISEKRKKAISALLEKRMNELEKY